MWIRQLPRSRARAKLAAVDARHGRSDFERHHYALFALMCVYGVELLEDNVAECRKNLRGTFTRFLKIDVDSVWSRAADAVLAVNVVRGDALAMKRANGDPIVFPEWGYIGRGKYQCREFLYANLTQRSSFQGTLFDGFEEHESFTPVRTYAAMTVQELAA